MSATLINPAAHWVDDSTIAREASPLLLIAAATPGHYVFATRARRAAGSLVARSGGGYEITIGVLDGVGVAAQVATGIVIF